MLITAPYIDIPTPSAFAALNAPDLTSIPPKSILKLCRHEMENLKTRQKIPINDFEDVIFKVEPELRKIKNKLIECGATTALMSGSGASIFGIFENEETRQATIKALDEEVNWRKFAVATVSRNEYREALEEVLQVVSD